MLRNNLSSITHILTKKVFSPIYAVKRNIGQFSVVSYEKSASPVQGNRKKIPGHELYHRNLQCNKSGEIIGAFTSNSNATPDTVVVSSTTKLDGSSGQQYLGVYKDVKVLTTDVVLIKKHPENQAFIDTHEKLFQEIREYKKSALRVLRTHKDNSMFFNEDGTRDDNFT
jgi:hypothetical protein